MKAFLLLALVLACLAHPVFASLINLNERLLLAFHDNPGNVKYLLDRGADMNASSSARNILLLRAVI
jgi:hypothetical protein